MLVLVSGGTSAFSRLAHPTNVRVPRTAIKMSEDPALEMAQLQQQLEIMRLKVQLAELQAQLAVPAPMEPPPAVKTIPEAIVAVQPSEAGVATVQAPEAVAAAVQAPEAAVAAVQTAPMQVMTLPGAPAVPDGQTGCFGDECTAAVVSSAVSGAVAEDLVRALGLVALVPLGWFGVTKFVEFINSRYDEIGGRVSGGKYATVGAPEAFSASERDALAEVALAESWEAQPAAVAGRSAPDILFGAIKNLADEPTGWFFGEPSALYSNAPAAARDSQLGARVASAMDYDLPTVTPPGPVMEAPAAARGRVVPTSQKGRKRRSKKARAAPRTPPSTPEEVAAARSGTYDFNPKA